MAEAERPLEEDWEKQQSKAWSLPPYNIGAIGSPDEDNQPSHTLNIPSGFSKDPTSLVIEVSSSTPQSAVPPTSLSPGQNTQTPSISASLPSGPSQQARGAGSSQQKISTPAPVVPSRSSPRPSRSWGGKKSTRQSTNTSGPPIQAQVSPFADGGARSHQPVRTQSSSPSVTQPQATGTQRSTVSQAFRRLETNISTHSVQGRVDSAAKDSLGKAKWRAGATPDGSLRLPLTIDRFQEIITQLTKETAQPVTNFRDFIVNATGAFLTVRYQGVPVVLIWGDVNQVLAAHTLLHTFVTQVNQLQETSKKVPGWTRINSHSTVKVDIANAKDAQTSQLDGLRKAPKVVADSTVCFPWPPNSPSLEHFLSSRRQLLDSIRLHYGMNIYTKPGAWENLYFSGGNEGDLLGMVSRSRDLWRTLSLQCETEIKVFLVEPPPPEIMRKDVTMKEYSDMAKPYLSGLKLPIEQAVPWEKKRAEARQDNKVIIVDRLKRALHLVPHFHSFRQMRAKFGSIVLKGYRKTEGADGPFLFPDFCDMIADTNAEGRLLPGLRLSPNQIITRVMGAGHLLVPAGTIPLRSLTKIQPRFSASFEYKIKNNHAVRIEANYSLPRGSEEFEVNDIRCFKPRGIGGPGEQEMPLQIGMIDFERSDWQLEIKALEMLEEEDTPPEVEAFKRKLSFVWNESAHSITSVPERMSRFPLGAPLSWLVEKAAIEFHVRGTNLVFELARFVKYTVTNGRILKTVDVSWGGSLFDPDWDVMLGENTELDGNQFTREACLSTFFPPAEGAEVDEDVQLGVFMSALRQIARVLGSPDSAVTNVLDCDVGTLF